MKKAAPLVRRRFFSANDPALERRYCAGGGGVVPVSAGGVVVEASGAGAISDGVGLGAGSVIAGGVVVVVVSLGGAPASVVSSFLAQPPANNRADTASKARARILDPPEGPMIVSVPY